MSRVGRWGVAGGLVLAACSNIDLIGPGVVALEVFRPPVTQVEVGDTLQLRARALDRSGQEVPGAEIRWRTPDPTVLAVDSITGVVTGLAGPGTGRVQSRTGSLVSNLLSLTVVARADTLIRVTEDTLRVNSGVTSSAALVTRLESFAPAGPVAGRPVIYQIIEPVFAQPADRTVELTGGLLVDTLTTAADGTPSPPVSIHRVAGRTSPDSAIVEIRAFRARGTVAVPGSGQRFVIRFTNP